MAKKSLNYVRAQGLTCFRLCPRTSIWATVPACARSPAPESQAKTLPYGGENQQPKQASCWRCDLCAHQAEGAERVDELFYVVAQHRFFAVGHSPQLNVRREAPLDQLFPIFSIDEPGAVRAGIPIDGTMIRGLCWVANRPGHHRFRGGAVDLGFG